MGWYRRCNQHRTRRKEAGQRAPRQEEKSQAQASVPVKDPERTAAADKPVLKEKPRVASQPKLKKVHKVAVKTESADDAVPTGAGAAAGYARRSAAGGDPFKSLLKSRGY